MKNINLVKYSFFTALICVFSCISIPFGIVPVSMSIPAILITARILGIKGAFYSVMAYILLGSFGLPVFSGFGSGIGVLFGPTGGYVWSYVPMAVLFAVTVKCANKYAAYILRVFLDFAALVICYLLGTVQFSAVQEISIMDAAVICVYPFVAVDIIKIVVSRYLSNIIYKRLVLGNLI